MNLVQFFKPKEVCMADSKELQELFHSCMPLFIALGDEVRLNIIEALCIASQNGHTEGLNVNEITRQTNLSRPAISHHLKMRTGRSYPVRYFQLLPSHLYGLHKAADETWLPGRRNLQPETVINAYIFSMYSRYYIPKGV